MKRPVIYILPTAIGLYFIAVTLILFMISLFFAHSLAYATTFLFFSFICFCAFITNSNIRSISLDPLTNHKYHGHEDQQTWSLLIKNHGQRTRYQIFFKGPLHIENPIHIGPLKTEKLFFATSLKRGIHTLKTLRPCSDFPVGLFCAWVVKKFDLRFFIAPKRENKTHLCIENFEHFGRNEGESADKIQGRDEFVDYKEYTNGDSVSSIDWKKSYQDNIYVKNYQGKSSKIYFINESIIESHVKNKRDIITCISYFVELCNTKGVHYAVKINGKTSSFGKGRQHWKNIIERLASFQEEREN